MARTLSMILALLILVLALVMFAAIGAWEISAETNKRLDRNLIYLKCSFEHLNQGQQRILQGIPLDPNPCVPSKR